VAKNGIFDLSGKVALVTGGGSGIGRAYCEAMAEYGADVACNDIDLQSALETVKIIGKFGHKAIAIEADASNQDDIEKMVDRTVGELGRLDILFCNAGIGLAGGRIHEIPADIWDRTMELILRGTFLLMQAALRYMVEQKSGSIITTASVAGTWVGGEGRNFTELTPYGVSKAGVVMLTKYAASEYGKDGIRVNSINPGFHRTNILNLLPPEQRKEREDLMIKNTALRRIAETEELKGLAVWLASDASSYVTGQIITQDGGLTL
jgi:NAD(P)-dependent dehydrogenase (short-subunit alcohol dehydrogenase family)